MTTRHERERQRDADGRLLVVQTFEDVQDRRDQHEHDRQLPCAASPSPKTSREHDQRQSSGDDQCACEARDGIRSDAFDQLDLASGALRWKHRIDAPNDGPNGLAISGSQIYGATDTTAFALDAATGRVRWSHRLANGDGSECGARRSIRCVGDCANRWGRIYRFSSGKAILI